MKLDLEDHAGRIINLACEAAKVPLAQAAQAAGLTEAELKTFIDTGKALKPVNYAAVGKLLGIDGARVERIAKGWYPAIPDLSLWREFRLIVTTKGTSIANAYLIWDEITREAALFDTGWDAEPIFKLVEENDLTLKFLFLTHLDEDHVAAMGAIRAKFPKMHLRVSSKTAPPESRNRGNEFLHLGSLRITNRETPGHTEEGTTYIIGNWAEDAPHVAIVGDAIFAGSMGSGRQSWDLAKQKVREQILTLPDEALLCPGHGPFTTVAEEKANNPFFA